MKKVWLILLAVVLAFGLVFVGCGGGSDDEEEEGIELVETVVFDMATDEEIQALDAGVITFAKNAPANAPNPIKPLTAAGNSDDHLTLTVVKQDGINSFEIETKDSWGVGLDLRFLDFSFREGDKVTVKGEIITLAGGRTQLNVKVGSENAIATHNAAGEFTLEATLTAANITDIKGGNPAGIRIENRATGMKVRIDNITVVGMRPSALIDLPAPVITRTETGIAWEAIDNCSGYKIFNGTTELGSVGAAATSFAIMTPGDYSVTVVALGLANVSRDSPASNVLTFTVAPLSGNMIPIAITTGTNISGFGGLDGDQDIDLLLDAKFLVLKFAGSNANNDGFGRMQIAIQGPGNGYDWNQTNTSDWTTFANDGTETIYVVFELSKLVGYPAAFDPDGDDPKGKIIFNHGIIDSGFVMAYLTSATTAPGTDDAAFDGNDNGGNDITGLGFISRAPGGLVFE